MSDNRPIDGMTADEWIIYGKGYTRGLKVGETIGEEKTQERIIKLLRDVGYPESTIALIKGEQK